MKLRLKVLSGFLVLALMLSVAGAWSIYELRSMSTAVQDLLDDNYKSIKAATMMLEALEREDSAILLLTQGRWREGRDIIESADSLFATGFHVAANNVTIPGETFYIQAIASAYDEYKGVWEKPIVDTQKQGNLTWYFESVHGAFVDVKSAVNDLMNLNAEVMFNTASAHREKANRSIMPGLVAVIAALVFSLMFSYFVNLYIVNPIVRITRGVRLFIKEGSDFDVHMETRDELSDLAESIQTLIVRVGRVDRVAGGDEG